MFGTTFNATVWQNINDLDKNNLRTGIIRVDQDQYSGMSIGSKLEDLEVVAYDCNLKFCRKTYSGTAVVNGSAPLQQDFRQNIRSITHDPWFGVTEDPVEEQDQTHKSS